MQKFLVPSPRVVYLQKLSLSMFSVFTYLQATSVHYGPRLKRAGDLLARANGATFAKSWRAKPAASIFTKLYHRRGQVPCGWLTDALQGRITCDSQEGVDKVVEFFTDIVTAQREAAFAAGRPAMGEEPTAEEIMAFDLTGLVHEESQKPVDELKTYCEEAMAAEGVEPPARPRGLGMHGLHACAGACSLVEGVDVASVNACGQGCGRHRCSDSALQHGTGNAATLQTRDLQCGTLCASHHPCGGRAWKGVGHRSLCGHSAFHRLQRSCRVLDALLSTRWGCR